ncbi:MAG: glycoside hydrolase family 20 zincin-like fold domain-containing protein [Thermomicrobiales bacterium]
MTDSLTLLPRPSTLTMTDGSFPLAADTRIQVAGTPSAATMHTARGLQDALAAQFGFVPPIVPTDQPEERDITFILDSGEDAAGVGLQGYSLRIGDQGVTVAANGEPGLFYGAQTLIQIAKSAGRLLPGLTIEDAPVLPNRGLMLDVSRGKVPTLETLIDLIKTLAHYKYNHFQLYTEHTFHFPSHPEIGAGAGSITPDDILALDAVCRAHHVELVPNFQSLGHQRALLGLERYAHLAETDWIFSFAVSNEGTYELLDELYGDLLPAFSSAWINVNADEPWDMGLGQSKALTDEIGVGRVYLTYIQRLHQLATKHGKKTMMWADMFWHHPDLIVEMPEEILFLDWWYERKERFDTVDAIASAGRRFWVCPGTSSWTTFFPRIENAVANIETFVRDGVAAGAEGMLLTDWGDGGHYQMLSNSWYPYLWGAECGWTGSTTNLATFEDACGRLFLGDYSGQVVAALHRLGASMQIDPRWTTTWNTPLALWEDPLAGDLWRQTPEKAVTESHAAAEALFPLLQAVRDPGIRADLGFAATLIRFACDKVTTARAIHQTLAGLASGELATDEGSPRLDALIAEVEHQRAALPALIVEFEQRWLAHARRSEIQGNLDRYAGLLTRYDEAIAWLEGQLEAATAGLPVDAALETYDRGDYAVLWQASLRNIQRLAEIIGEEALPPDIRGWLSALGERAT